MKIARLKAGRFLRSLIAVGLFATTSFSLSSFSAARAEGTFISAQGRTDFAHDTQRGVIYISSGSRILCYSIASNSFLTPFNLPQNRVAGQIDISPDGNTLAVATTPLPGTTIVDSPTFTLFSLNSGNYGAQIPVGSVNLGYGAMSVSFDNAGTLFVVPQTSSTGYAGNLWRYDLLTKSAISLPYYGLSKPVLQPSSSRELIGFTERGNDGGSWGFYDVPSSTIVWPPSRVQNGTRQFNYQIGVSGDGSQYGLPNYGGVMIYNQAGTRTNLLGNYGSIPENTGMGIAYNPVAPRVYIPWSNTSEVRVFDTATYAQVGSYNFETNFDWQNTASWRKGHTRVSEDGSLLMVSVDNGVRFVQLAPVGPRPLRALGATYSFNEDSIYQIGFKSTGGSPTHGVVYDVVTSPQNGVLTGTGAGRVYTPNPNFNGTDKFRVCVSQDGQISYAWIYLNIKPVNDAPTQPPIAPVQVRSGGWVQISSAAPTDPDGPLTSYSYRVVRQGSNGTANIDPFGGGLIYRPNAGYSGPDSFDIVVNDGNPYASPPVPGLDSAPVTVEVNVINNAAPVAQNDSYFNVSRYSSFTVPAPGVLGNDSDADGDAITVKRGVDYVSWGSASISPDGSLRWDPWYSQILYESKITITYYVYDYLGAGNKATVTLGFGAPASAPPQNVSTTENTAVPITLSGAGEPSLFYAITAKPTHGTLSGIAPNLTYTPATDFNGSDEFTFSVTSENTSSATAKVSISVAPANSKPVANNSSASGTEETDVDVPLSASDPDGDALTYTITHQPAHGTLSGTAPNLVYHGNDNFFGSDNFAFKVSDGTLESSEAVVSISLANSSDRPVAGADSFDTNEDTTLNIPAPGVLFNDSDPDGDTLSAAITTQPSHGTLVLNANGGFSYTPDTNWNGTDSFTYTASDGVLGAVGTVTIQVAAVNDAPVATNTSRSLDEDSFLRVSLEGGDVDTPLAQRQYSIVTPPEHGTLGQIVFGSASATPMVTYTPNPNYYGTDSFTWKIFDGQLESNIGTVNLTINNVAEPPVANPQTVSTPEDTAKDIVVTVTYPDGPPTPGTSGSFLIYRIARKPLNGSISGTGPNYKYTPNSNWSGTDSFEFEVSTNLAAFIPVSRATVTVNVTPVNDLPVSQSAAYTTAEDTAVNVVLGASDVENDALTYVIDGQPANGTLTGTAPNLVFTPNANFNGNTSFSFHANDAEGAGASATVTITVTPSPDAPVAANDSFQTDEDKALAITAPGILVNDSDSDGEALSALMKTSPTHGSLTLNADGGFVYTPEANYNGSDSFTYVASDGALESAVATVSIQVASVIDNPVAANDSLNAVEDESLVIDDVTLLANDSLGDVESDELIVEIVNYPLHGTLDRYLDFTDYTSDANYNGPDSFTYRIGDGVHWSNQATVELEVIPVNDAPQSEVWNKSVVEDGSYRFTPVLQDAEGDVLTYLIKTLPAHGTLVVDNNTGAPSYVYTPAPNYNGEDVLVVEGTDSGNKKGTLAIYLTVTAVNDAPLAIAKSMETNEDTPLAIALTGSDIDSANLTFSVQSQPQNGVLSGSGANLTFTPNANWNGQTTFTFTVSDGELSSAPATVSISVKPINDAPTANAQSVTTAQNTAKAITLSGSDIDGDALSFVIVSNPAKGTLSGSGANRTYTPNFGASGADSFTFQVSDGKLNSTVVTVSITITGAQPIPVAQAKTVSVLEDQNITISLSGTAYDGASIDTWTVVTNPANGTLSGGGNARNYVGNANFFGTDSFTYKVRDNRGNWSDPATVTITVTPVNDAPSFNLPSASITATKNSSAQTRVGFATGASAGPNESSQTLSYVVTNYTQNLFSVQPAVSSDGTLRFTVANGKTGTANLQIVIKDNGGTANNGQDTSQPKSFTIRIQ